MVRHLLSLQPCTKLSNGDFVIYIATLSYLLWSWFCSCCVLAMQLAIIYIGDVQRRCDVETSKHTSICYLEWQSSSRYISLMAAATKISKSHYAHERTKLMENSYHMSYSQPRTTLDHRTPPHSTMMYKWWWWSLLLDISCNLLMHHIFPAYRAIKHTKHSRIPFPFQCNFTKISCLIKRKNEAWHLVVRRYYKHIK